MQGSGLAICYTWAEWLRTEALTTLGYDSSLPVQPIATALQTASVSPSGATASPAQPHAHVDVIVAEPDAGTWEELLVQLLLADAARDFQRFQEVRRLAGRSPQFQLNMFGTSLSHADGAFACVPVSNRMEKLRA